MFVGEGSVPAVHPDLAQGRIIADAVLVEVPHLAVPVKHDGVFHILGVCGLAGKDDAAQGDGVAFADRIGGGSQQVEAGVVVLQFAAGKPGLEIAGQQFHADHAVHGAVLKDEGLAVRDGRAVVAAQGVRGGDQPSVLPGVQLDLGGVGRLEGQLQKAALAPALIEDRGRPALVGGDGVVLDDLGGCPLEKKVCVLLGGGGVRVEIPQVEAGDGGVDLPLVQIVGVQQDKDAGGRAAAQCVDEVRHDGVQQGQAVLTALVDGIEIQCALVQQLLGHVVDLGADIGQLPDLGELAVDVVGAVFHLLVQNVDGVLAQLLTDLRKLDGAVQQKGFHHQHDDQGRKDGEENRAFPFSGDGERCVFHR